MEVQNIWKQVERGTKALRMLFNFLVLKISGLWKTGAVVLIQ